MKMGRCAEDFGNISLMKINNIIFMLHTRIILLSSVVIYFFCRCHSGSFPK